MLSFAAALEHAGHILHVPDLFEGRTFSDLASGVDYASQIGFDVIIERGRLARGCLTNALGIPAGPEVGGYSGVGVRSTGVPPNRIEYPARRIKRGNVASPNRPVYGSG